VVLRLYPVTNTALPSGLTATENAASLPLPGRGSALPTPGNPAPALPEPSAGPPRRSPGARCSLPGPVARHTRHNNHYSQQAPHKLPAHPATPHRTHQAGPSSSWSIGSAHTGTATREGNSRTPAPRSSEPNRPRSGPCHIVPRRCVHAMRGAPRRSTRSAPGAGCAFTPRSARRTAALRAPFRRKADHNT